MKRQLTLREYRTIDLALLALLLALFEFLIVRFAINSYYSISLAAIITSIVYMRWGWWGAIHAALAGALYPLYFSLAAPGAFPGPVVYPIYILGNLVSLLAVPVLEKRGKERVRGSVLASLAFSLAVILLMQGGRAAVAVALGAVTPAESRSYFTTDALSILFTLVATWIVRRLDGVFEDQRHYLIRLQEERERNNDRNHTEL